MSTNNRQNGHRRPIDWIAERLQNADLTTTDAAVRSSAEGSGAKRRVQIVRLTAADDERIGAWVDLKDVPEWIDADTDLPVTSTALWDYYIDDVEPPEGA